MTEPVAPKSQDNVYEMLWDCRYCDTKKLLGLTHRFCPNCGAPQDPEWRYFPSDAEKVAVKDHIYYGADKICPACGTAVSANSQFCGRCSAPLTEAAQVKLQAIREKREGERFETEDLTARQDREQDIFLGRVQPEASKNNRKRNTILLAVGLGVAAVLVLVMLAVFWKKETVVTVAGHRWEREITIETFTAVSQHSDCNAVPAGAYSVDRRYEQVGSRQVADGQECSNRQVDQGDGTFREERVCETTYRSEPVYGYVCYYAINLWLESRSVRAEGDLSVKLYWPETQITRAGVCLGCEREGKRTETYRLILTNPDGKTYTCAVPFEDWQAASVATAFRLQVRVILGSADCGSLERTQATP